MRLVCGAGIVEVGVFSGTDTVEDGVRAGRVDVVPGIAVGLMAGVGEIWFAPEHALINTKKMRIAGHKSLFINVVFIASFRVVLYCIIKE